MRSNDYNDWPVHSLMFSLHDLRGLPLRRLPSTDPCSMIFGISSWWQTWPNHDNLRHVRVDNKSSWYLARTLTFCHTYSSMFSVWHAKHPPVAFVFKGTDSYPSRPFYTVGRLNWSFNLWAKLQPPPHYSFITKWRVGDSFAFVPSPNYDRATKWNYIRTVNLLTKFKLEIFSKTAP